MTIMHRDTEQRVILHREGMDEFWTLVERIYKKDEQTKWKYLGMLSLHVVAGWTLDRVGYAFGHSRGHVSRCLRKIQSDLHQRITLADDWLPDLDEE